MARVAYFVRGSGERWAVIRLTGRDREEIVVDGLSRDAAEELCFEKLEEQLAGFPGADETPAPDIAADERRAGRRRPRQLAFKF